MSIIGSNLIAGASGQGAGGGGGGGGTPSGQVDRSLRFNTAHQSYLSRTPTTAGNRRTFTWSGWVKRTELGSSQTIFGTRGSGAQEANSFDMKFDTSNRLWVGYGNGARKITSNHFRDCSAWLHIVVAYDTTQSTGDDRIKIYINGVRETNLDTNSNPSLNQETGVNNTQNQYIGAYYVPNARQHPNIYLANVHLIDGQQLEPTDFGEFNTNNLWVPKAYSGGTYGTNGFYLDFSDNTSTTTLGEDSSGNGNDFTLNGFSVASGADNDSLIDTPTNYTASGNNGGNYAILNPLTGVNLDLSDGNLEQAAASSWSRVFPTIMPNTGKWYVECFLTDYSYGARTFNVGVAPIENITSDTTGKPGSETDEIAYEAQFQKITVNNSNSQTGLSAYTTNSIVGVAIDFDNRTVQFYLNNSAEGTAETFPDHLKDYTFIIGNIATSGSTDVIVNFGQRPFEYTPPTGFKSLCTTNLPDPTIAEGSTAMDVKLYTGNGSTQTISGLEFSPDLVWIKNRSQADNHKLLDTVRGVTDELESNTTDAEVTNSDGLTAFNSDGFDLGADVSYNTNSESYVAWTWDAGTSNTSISAGGLNSSAYDQSQTWSNMLTAELSGSVSGPTNAFDSTPGVTSSTSARTGPTSTQGGVVFTPTNGYTVNSQIRVYRGSSADECFLDFGSGYGSAISLTSGWSTVYTGSGTLSALKVKDPNGANNSGLGGIEIDGKLLVDSGVTVANVPTIASTVRANPSAGFSIVSYTGNSTSNATVGHGLNAAPEFLIVKNRDKALNWGIWHSGLTDSQILRFNSSAATTPTTAYFEPQNNTSSVFSLGTNDETNESGDNYIAYCFTSVEGYSKFGTYEGGSSEPPFVYLGFKPRFLLLKRSNYTDHWHIFDTARDEFNEADAQLRPSSSSAETTAIFADFLSNGFKIQVSSGTYNSNYTFIYAAFGDPFKTARAC